MIYTERKVTIKNGNSSIDNPIILYRGDREVEILFTIIDSKFKFGSSKGNVIDTTQAAYGQLAVSLPDGTDLFTEIVECQNGVVLFNITGEMIDEINEVGFYSFHIRLYNDDKTSRITIPPVMEGIEIREPLVIESDVENTDIIGDATVGFSMIQTYGAEEDAFDEEGNYNATVWGVGDKITAEKLNKVEGAVITINENVLKNALTIDDMQNDIQNLKDNASQGLTDKSVKMNHLSDEVIDSMSNNIIPTIENRIQFFNNGITPEENMSSVKLVIDSDDDIILVERGLNQFNVADFTDYSTYASGGAYYSKPIYLEANTKYDIYMFFKEGYDKESYSVPGNNVLINTEHDTYTSGRTAMSFKISDDSVKTLITNNVGCLYVTPIYGDQEQLDYVFNAIDVVIVKSGENVDGFIECEEKIIDVVSDTEQYIDLTVGKTYVYNKRRVVKDDMLAELSVRDAYVAYQNVDYETMKYELGLVEQEGHTKSPLIYYTENLSFLYSLHLPDVLKNNNTPIKISGNAGDTFITLIDDESNGFELATIADETNWSGVIGYGDGVFKPCMVTSVNVDNSTINIYPPLERDIVDGTLCNMQVDDMHLTENGYKAYMQHNYSQNPKHCERGKYLQQFVPEFESDTSNHPFSTFGNRLYYNGGKLNIGEKILNAYSQQTGTFSNPWDAEVEGDTGIEWTVQLHGLTGYLELVLSGISNSDIGAIACDDGYEMHIEFYLDDSLVEHVVKDYRSISRHCFDYEGAEIGKIRIYYNKMRMSNEEIRISRVTWWVNEYDHAELLFPKYSVVAQLFDSWGEFHEGASGKELHRLIQNECNVPIPYFNNSKGSQTSAWGRSWWFENVWKCNPTIMITDFAINDGNSINYGLPETVEGSDGTEYDNHLTVDEYIKNMNDIFDMCLKYNIQPIMFGHTISYGAWYLQLTKGTQYII